jgi:SAM-dependent methyltransferase
MDSSLLKLKEVWETLGHEDPLWAVVSRPDKRGGRWELPEFLATGEEDVARFSDVLRSLPGAPERFVHVLDFGCGVGRLSLAWRRRAGRVTGVDISGPMVIQARRLASGHAGVDYVVNQRPDLAVFADNTFDLCFSHICLQHMPWELAAGYLREFGRVCSPGGWIAFQLPSRRAAGGGMAAVRQRLVESLPFGLDRIYRKWRHGSSAVFDVYYTPPSRVREVLGSAGLEVVMQAPDLAAGPGSEGFIYVARRRG